MRKMKKINYSTKFGNHRSYFDDRMLKSSKTKKKHHQQQQHIGVKPMLVSLGIKKTSR